MFQYLRYNPKPFKCNLVSKIAVLLFLTAYWVACQNFPWLNLLCKEWILIELFKGIHRVDFDRLKMSSSLFCQKMYVLRVVEMPASPSDEIRKQTLSLIGNTYSVTRLPASLRRVGNQSVICMSWLETRWGLARRGLHMLPMARTPPSHGPPLICRIKQSVMWTECA